MIELVDACLRCDEPLSLTEAMSGVEFCQQCRDDMNTPACNHHHRKTEHTYDYCVDCGAHFSHDSYEGEDDE